MSIINNINNILWGGFLLLLLLFTGVYLTIGCRFLQFTHIKKITAETVGSFRKRKKSKEEVSPFAAMSAALGGTIGTGNIAGVGLSIALGGAGSIFWMWVSALICMIIKFAEVTLAVHFREKSSNEYNGGPMYYIKNGLPKKFIPLATIFSVCCMLASFGIGNTAQINAVANSVNDSMGIPAIYIGILMALIAAPAIFGSAKKLTDITSKIVPIMALFYTAGIAAIIFININRLPFAFSEIFTESFGIKPLAGGAAGFTVANMAKQGLARGIFTNEAGMGSAPIIHAAAENTPIKQGYWGIFEVVFDTLIMCTLTALAIITSKAYINNKTIGGVLTGSAFKESFGSTGGIFIAISLFLFAYGAIISWSFYGSKSLAFLNKNKTIEKSYKLLFCIFIIPGSIIGTQKIFAISDMLNGFMIIPNIIAIILLSGVLFNLVKK